MTVIFLDGNKKMLSLTVMFLFFNTPKIKT